jgi:type I restriction enzyme, S subunit
MSEMPNGWTQVPVTDVISLHDNRRVPLNGTQREKMKGDYPYYGANGLVDHINKYIFDGEYALLAEDGGYFDDPKRGVAYEASGKFWVNNHAHILQALGGMSNRFLTLALNAINWMPHVGGSTRLKLTQGGLQQALMCVPPLPEQQRIVAKIDSLSAKSRRARDHLDHVPRLVEKYKQAILAAAFRGELTREWRATDDAKTGTVEHYRSHTDAPTSELPDLPTSWRWQIISEVMEISGGLTKNPKRSAMAMRRPYLRVANVYANELRLADISETGCSESEFEKTKLISGDLLIVEGNGSLEQIGRVAIWNDEIRDCSHQNHIIRARPSEIVEPRYALFWLLSPTGREAIEAVASSSSGLHTLSITKVGRLPVPLCAKEEQLVIVRLIDIAFSWIDRLASETTSASRLIDHLDQSILAKAFRGELVPQDPDDEPASILLERIKTERSAAQPRRGRESRA